MFYNVTRAQRVLLIHLGITLLMVFDEYTVNSNPQLGLLAKVFITKSSRFRRAAREQKTNLCCLQEKGKDKNQVKY